MSGFALASFASFRLQVACHVHMHACMRAAAAAAMVRACLDEPACMLLLLLLRDRKRRADRLLGS